MKSFENTIPKRRNQNRNLFYSQDFSIKKKEEERCIFERKTLWELKL